MSNTAGSARFRKHAAGTAASKVSKEPIGRNALLERMSENGTLQKFATFRSVAEGIPSRSVREMESQGLTRDDIRQIIPDRTLERRIAQGENLKLEEADGLARLLRVVSFARRVFENDDVADEWLHTSNPSLDDLVPIEMARTDLGGREVEAVLGRIERGVFS